MQSKQLLKRIQTRDVYKLVGDIEYPKDPLFDVSTVEAMWYTYIV